MPLLRLAVAVAAAALTFGCASMTPLTVAKDPYAWLEEIEGPKSLDWVKAQNARSLTELEADPRFAGLKADALAIVNSRDRLPVGAVRGGFVYNFWQDATQVRGVWRRASIASYNANAPVWENILDFDALAKAENRNWVFQGANCLPPEGARCLISLSDGGKDARVQREFDVSTRSFVPGGFVTPEAKSIAIWKDRDTLLVASDWGPGSLSDSGYPFIVKAWMRGAALEAATEVIRGEKADIGLFLSRYTGEDGQTLLVAAQQLDFFSTIYWRLDGETPVKLTLPRKSSVRGLHKGEIIFSTEEDWRQPGLEKVWPSGSLMSMPLAQASEAAPPVRLIYGAVPRESIEQSAVTRDGLLVAVYRNVRGVLLRFVFDGRAWVESQIPLATNGGVSISAAPDQSAAFLVAEDFLRPDTLMAVDARSSSAPKSVRALPSMFDAAKFTVDQFEATSKDGTKIPYFVLRAKDLKFDGQAPTLLYGYGGFQISLTPSYSPFVGKMWLERGGVYVLANIRGGGEFGPAWHQAGLKLNRQVVYDDFIAVAEDLSTRKITSPRRLGIMGGSNGGLLMGVMMSQRPDLFRAAVVQVPLLDMLGFANANMLAGSSWVAEYGDPRLGPDGKPTHQDERAYLTKLSPYQNLKKRPDMPAPFFVGSTKDDRVHPAHARKYAAKMEALGMPFYFYENTDGGHAAAANLQEQAHRRALEMTYLMRRLMD
ncbi:MAG: prolyl oligopeptidase family serine peptidase [Caulobacterales bacterium]